SLYSLQGAEARAYLNTRQISQPTREAYAIGFAPNHRTGLKDHLIQKGFDVDDMIRAGMLIGGEDIAKPYDRFRNRITFPIHDQNGRVIAFGGRTLDPNQPAKYLNSPETPLFHKGRVLYNFHRARPVAYDEKEIIVVEGYMDVIALDGAGIMNAVAPLGTALTSDQLTSLWRVCVEPTLCFDGDSAGRRAAHRAVETALPALKPGYSLRFAFLEKGLDPDDLIRRDGPSAMRTVLNSSHPLIEVLWQREWQSGDWSTPERRAGLEAQLKAQIEEISDQGVRDHYNRALKERLYHAWRQSKYTAPRQSLRHGGRARNVPPGLPHHRDGRASTKPRRPATPDGSAITPQPNPLASAPAQRNREVLILRAIINHPWLIELHAEEIADLTLDTPSLIRIRDGMLRLIADERPIEPQSIQTQLSEIGLAEDLKHLKSLTTHRSDKFAEKNADPTDVEVGFHHTLAMHSRQSLLDQLALAEKEFHVTGEEDAMARIVEIQKQIAEVTTFDQ
ncbi:MAG: DNA primase, partial [Hyphomicrobiaceae bacterium]